MRFVSEQSLTSGVTGNLATKVEDGTRFTLSDSNGGKTPYTDVLTFVVTGAPGDETGNEVVVQIPVGVTATTDAAVNEPPTWPRTDSIEVTQDGEPSLPVDLTKLAKDPEGDDLSFEVEPGEGLSVEGDPSGGTLRLVGSKDLALGSGAAAVTVWADDGQEGHTPVKKELPVTGIKTNKAMPTLRPVPTVDDATRRAFHGERARGLHGSAREGTRGDQRGGRCESGSVVVRPRWRGELHPCASGCRDGVVRGR